MRRATAPRSARSRPADDVQVELRDIEAAAAALLEDRGPAPQNADVEESASIVAGLLRRRAEAKAKTAPGAPVEKRADARPEDDVRALTKDQLVRRHIGLVKQVARRYSIDASHYDDMIQEGTMGVLRAAETFDPKFKVKFSTYATYWIRTRIQRYLAAVRGHEFGAPASVAWACGRTRGKASYRPLARSLSLEDTKAAEGRPLEEVVPSDSVDPEEHASSVEVKARVAAALQVAAKRLNDPRTTLLIEERLLSDEPKTLAELGVKLDLSREGARLLEARLLRLAKQELEAA